MNKILDMESQLPVEKIQYKGIPIWGYLRIYYSATLTKKTAEQSGEHSQRLRFNLTMLKTLFNGWSNLFRHFDYIILTNDTERKQLHGLMYNKLMDPIADLLGQDKTLFLEQTVSQKRVGLRTHSSHILNDNGIRVVARIIAKFAKMFKFVPKIENAHLLDRFNHELGIKVDYNKLIIVFNIKCAYYSWLINRNRPIFCFVTDHYSNLPFVSAAKNCGATIIESQHGVLNETAYSYQIHIDPSFKVDYFLCYGENTKRKLEDSLFLDPNHVFSVGSYYLEVLRRPLPQRSSNYSIYDLVIAVTLSWTVEVQQLEFVKKAASIDRRIAYIMVPDLRIKSPKSYENIDLGENVFFEFAKDFYELMGEVDIHATVYSTCAIEAPSLGVPNILMDISQLATKYLSSMLLDEKLALFAENPDDFVQYARSFVFEARENVMLRNSGNFEPFYTNNLKAFLATINSNFRELYEFD